MDVIVGLDARGFLFGPTLALRLGAAFVPVRKQGKLPGKCVTAEYMKEYGKDIFCAQHDAITTGQKVIIVDDIIATGGSAAAAGQIVKQLGGNTLEYAFMLELDFLKGRDKLVSQYSVDLNYLWSSNRCRTPRYSRYSVRNRVDTDKHVKSLLTSIHCLCPS